MPKTTMASLERTENLLVEIQSDRLQSQQELGWLFRPLAVCPFPASSLGKLTIIRAGGAPTEAYEVLWRRRAGNVRVEILGHPDYGIPHGQDTLIVLFLAYEARRQGSRRIRVDFYRDFMRLFGMNPNDGRKYRLVIQSLQRIRNSRYSWEVIGERREQGLNFLYIDDYDLFCDPKHPDQPPLFDQYIMLSERFWQEIQKHRIPSNLKAIRALKSQPARLNFYLWLSYRVGQAYQETIGHGQDAQVITIPFWGDHGLQQQMSSVIEEKRNFRIHVKRWLNSVIEFWPRCPVEIVGDALIIHVTNQDQLDILPKDTDAPRILPCATDTANASDPQQSTCPHCGGLRTLREGKMSVRGGYRMPDYWQCSGAECTPKTESVDAICRECGATMRVKNKGKSDYSYTCPQCGNIDGGENYWIQNSVFR